VSVPRPAGYRILREADLRDYLAGLPAVTARLGGSPDVWSINEVGDGNLNLVFIRCRFRARTSNIWR
jgi:5-methylthioribose kinase